MAQPNYSGGSIPVLGAAGVAVASVASHSQSTTINGPGLDADDMEGAAALYAMIKDSIHPEGHSLHTQDGGARAFWEGAAQVDGDRPVPGIDVELMEAVRPAGDAGVVDQHVESSETGDGAVDQGG